jgi:hypothetical protein
MPSNDCWRLELKHETMMYRNKFLIVCFTASVSVSMTGQKQILTELKSSWPVILTGNLSRWITEHRYIQTRYHRWKYHILVMKIPHPCYEKYSSLNKYVYMTVGCILLCLTNCYYLFSSTKMSYLKMRRLVSLSALPLRAARSFCM